MAPSLSIMVSVSSIKLPPPTGFRRQDMLLATAYHCRTANEHRRRGIRSRPGVGSWAPLLVPADPHAKAQMPRRVNRNPFPSLTRRRHRLPRQLSEQLRARLFFGVFVIAMPVMVTDARLSKHSKTKTLR
jgi:hypothetical protein